MKNKIRNAILIFVALVYICLLIPVMFSNDEIVERKFKDNLTPIITMEDLNFRNSNIEESSISILMSRNNKIGNVYNLSMYTNYDNNVLSVDLNVYILEGNIDVDAYSQKIIENKYTDIKKKENNCIGSKCIFPTINYESAIEKMYKLNESQWNTEKVYSVYDLNSIENNINNIIFVQSNNKVIVICLSKEIELTNERIEIFNECFDSVQKKLENDF